MFNTVRKWMDEHPRRNQVPNLLSSESVKSGKNHVLHGQKSRSGPGHSCGGGHGKTTGGLWSQVTTRDMVDAEGGAPPGLGPTESSYGYHGEGKGASYSGGEASSYYGSSSHGPGSQGHSSRPSSSGYSPRPPQGHSPRPPHGQSPGYQQPSPGYPPQGYQQPSPGYQQPPPGYPPHGHQPPHGYQQPPQGHYPPQQPTYGGGPPQGQYPQGQYPPQPPYQSYPHHR